MKPVIIHQPRLILAGMSFYGDPFDTRQAWSEDNHIGSLWARFTAFMQGSANPLPGVVDAGVGYEVHISGMETAEKGYFEVFVGVQVNDISQIPVEMLLKILPEGDYAVFTLAGEQIATDWEMEIGQALAVEGFQQSHPFGCQRYDRRFKGMQHLSESEVDVLVPVKRGKA